MIIVLSHYFFLEWMHDARFSYPQNAYRQLKARKALSIFKDVSLRTRRMLSLNNVYGDSALLVLNGTYLNSESALMALN